MLGGTETEGTGQARVERRLGGQPQDPADHDHHPCDPRHVPKGGDHTDTRTQDSETLATLMYQGWEASRYKEPRRLTIKRNAMRGRDREKATTQIVDVRSSDVAVMNGCTRYTQSTMRPACDVVLLSRMFEELLSKSLSFRSSLTVIAPWSSDQDVNRVVSARRTRLPTSRGRRTARPRTSHGSKG